MSFLFKVKIQGVAKRLEFKEEELDNPNIENLFYSKGKILLIVQIKTHSTVNMINVFLILAFTTFEIGNKGDLFIKLADRDGDTILNEHLHKLLWQYKLDSQFLVEMIFKDGVVTSENAQVLNCLLALISLLSQIILRNYQMFPLSRC